MILLLLTTFHKRENFETDEELGSLGGEAGRALHDIIYQTVYLSHSQACAILKNKKDMAIKQVTRMLDKFPDEPLDDEQLDELKSTTAEMLETVELQIKRVEDETGLDGTSLRRLGKKYVDVVTKKLEGGKKPSEKFLGKQYDKFVEAFCEKVDDAKLLPIVDERLKALDSGISFTEDDDGEASSTRPATPPAELNEPPTYSSETEGGPP